jgi:hypothetical protein
MRTFDKKVWPEYFDALVSGKKKFDLRLNKEDINEGDVLFLREWDPKAKEYTGRQMEKKVTYALVAKIDDLFWPEQEIKEKGLRILSLE